jgi:hypothetical protein
MRYEVAKTVIDAHLAKHQILLNRNPIFSNQKVL